MKTDIRALIRKNIQTLVPYSSARAEYAGKEGIFLDANENPYGLYNRYPDPEQSELKQQLSEIKGIGPDQIFIGNGSDEIIDLAFRIFCEPFQDTVLIFGPTYGLYEVAAGIHAVEVLNLPLTTDFQIDMDALEPYFADDRLKIIFICSPNNPTGNLLRSADIEFILQRFEGLLIVDEAYIDFCDQPSFLKRIGTYPKLIVIQTLSKAWGLAGARIGMAFMSKELIAYFNTIKSPYNVSTLNQQAALRALRNRNDHQDRIHSILKEKQRLISGLRRLRSVRRIYPSDANFLLVEVDCADQLYTRLIEKQIVIRNRSMLLRNCVRITVGTPEENQRLLTALAEIDHD